MTFKLESQGGQLFSQCFFMLLAKETFIVPKRIIWSFWYFLDPYVTIFHQICRRIGTSACRILSRSSYSIPATASATYAACRGTSTCCQPPACSTCCSASCQRSDITNNSTGTIPSTSKSTTTDRCEKSTTYLFSCDRWTSGWWCHECI